MPLLIDYPEASTEQELLIPVQVKGEHEWRHISFSKLAGGGENYWFESNIETPIVISFDID